MHHRGPAFDIQKLLQRREHLECAVYETLWLLKRGYRQESAATFVSNHHQLLSIQRKALQKAAVLSQNRSLRSVRNKTVYLDGFNILISVEAALAGSIIIKCADGCYRDLSQIYGNYRIVEETVPAIDLLVRTLERLQVKRALWIFDKNVSNSLKLAKLFDARCQKSPLDCQVEVRERVDGFLKRCQDVVITCDSGIIKYLAKWYNLSKFLFEKMYKDAQILHLDIKRDPMKREGK